MSIDNYIIYALIDPHTNEVRYIGRSCSGLKRPREHSCPKNLRTKRTHCVSWIKSLNGEKPKVDILDIGLDSKHLDSLEQKWISFGKSIGWNLTNHAAGGGGSKEYRHTAEAKAKISAANTKELHSLWKGGLPRCVDCDSLLRCYNSLRCKSCAGKHRYKSKKKEYKCLDCSTMITRGGVRCRKCSAIARQKPHSCIYCGSRTYSTKCTTCINCKNVKPISVSTKAGHFIGTWKSAMSCSNELQISYDGIWKCLVGKRKTHKNLVFRYIPMEVSH